MLETATVTQTRTMRKVNIIGQITGVDGVLVPPPRLVEPGTQDNTEHNYLNLSTNEFLTKHNGVTVNSSTSVIFPFISYNMVLARPVRSIDTLYY